MKKIIFLFCLLSVMNAKANTSLLASSDNYKTIKGTVIYSDDHSPLLKGIIKIFKINEASGCETYTGYIHNGFFKFENINIGDEDNIHIMAYPYDLDRINTEPTAKDDIHIMAYPYDLDNNYIEPVSEDNTPIMAYPYDLDRINAEPTTEDSTPIMAYPYNIDNPGFINKPFDLKNIIQESDKNEIEIVIKIRRANLEEIKTSTAKLSTSTVPGEEELIKNTSVELEQNYPNPFNPSTLIRFNLSYAMNVSLQVYSMNGKLISTLINNKVLPAGDRHVQFNANELPSGIYIYKLVAGNQTLTQKMMLLK
jgi:hypothetical protein